jgi:glucosyl-3-phosphoglycerate synthase
VEEAEGEGDEADHRRQGGASNRTLDNRQNSNMDNVTVIIPAKDEEKTIGKVIQVVQKVADEVIVIDGFSEDRTREIAKELGAKVYVQQHYGNKKGEAMRHGLNVAQGDIIVYVDADIRNIRPSWIKKLIEPLRKDIYDFVKAEYKRGKHDAPVTKLVAKPLLKKYFRELYWGVPCPLEGEIAARKSTFKKLHFRDDWGIDVGLVISAFKLGFRICSVKLGYKQHNPSYDSDLSELEDMAYDVADEILRNVKERTDQR